MAASAARLSVGTTATALTAGQEEDFTPGHSVVIYNPGPATVDVGGSDVTAGQGYALASDATLSADLGRGELLYGVVASGTQTIHVLQTGA